MLYQGSESGPGTVRALPDIGVDVLEGRTGGAAAGKNDGRKEKEDKAYVVHKGLLVKKETSQGLFLRLDCVSELLGGRCFSSGSFGGGSGLSSFLAAAAGRLLGLLRSSESSFVEVDELDEGHLSGITLTEAGVEDTEVSARTVSNLRSNRAEELRNGVLVLQVAENDTAGVGGVFLGLGNEGFEIRLEGLRLRNGRLNPLVEDQGRSHVGKGSLAVTALTSKMIDGSIVSHF